MSLVCLKNQKLKIEREKKILELILAYNVRKALQALNLNQ
jgi:hypothetical protein